MPKISVVVALYNGEKTIKETITSILAQTYKDFELIIVDDGSTDTSKKIIESFEDVRIRYFYEKNSGSPSRPRNMAISKSTSDLIALCDQDDIWYPSKLEVQVTEYEKNRKTGNVGLIISSADLIGSKISENLVPRVGLISQETFFNDLLRGNFVSTCSALIPKKILDEVGGFDEEQIGVDDYDLWLRIAEKYNLLAIKKKLCAWRYGKSSLSASKTNIYMETEKVFTKLEKRIHADTVKAGHGRNLGRIFVAGILEENKEAIGYFEKMSPNYPVSKNIAKIHGLFRIMPGTAKIVLNLLKFFRKVSL